MGNVFSLLHSGNTERRELDVVEEGAKRDEIWAHVGRVRPEQEREGKKSGKW